MRKWIICMMVFLLLAIPVSADTPLLVDDSGLLPEGQVAFVEEALREVEAAEGFSPIVVTIDSFGGLSAEDYAANFYDAYGYGTDGILLLVSLEEGQWHILTNGLCAQRISDPEAAELGEQILPKIRDGLYYEAFLDFAQLAAEAMQPDPGVSEQNIQDEYAEEESTGKGLVILICMAIGLGIGILVMAYMHSKMKTVSSKDHAADYILSGSLVMTQSRDIFLYSHVTRTPKPKSNSSGRSHGGGSRGGAGGRI